MIQDTGTVSTIDPPVPYFPGACPAAPPSPAHEPLLQVVNSEAPAAEQVESAGPDSTVASDEPPPFQNYSAELVGDKQQKEGRRMDDMYQELLQRTVGWPKRVGEQLFVATADKTLRWLNNPSRLYAWLNGFFRVVWATGPGLITREQFFQYLRMNCPSCRAVELVPHFPALADVCYVHPELPASTGNAFQELVSRFCPATAVDADLIKAFFLTPFWGGKGGSRPAWLFTGPEDDAKRGVGVGKTTLVQMAGALVGGCIDITHGEDIAAIKKRVLSPSALHQRVVVIDNVKEHMNWAELEALITTPVISGHRLYVGEATRLNTLTWALTINGASLSRDLAQRCVIVQLKRPTYDASWASDTLQFIEANKWSIISDIRHELTA